jgi:phosphoenolpyruvate synthase/pyruvate phosphate dikinase
MIIIARLKKKAVEKLIISLYVILFVVLACASYVHDEQGHYLPQWGRDKIHFNARLVYHDLNYDVSVIYRDKNGMYFFRDQKRCKF